MKTNKGKVDHSFVLKVTPELIHNEEEESYGAKFEWSIYQRPFEIIEVEDGLSVKFPKEKQNVSKNLTDFQLMRFFACNIVRDLINNNQKVDQSGVYTKIHLPNVSDEIKDFVVNVIHEVERGLIEEIFFQNNPIKPTKSKIEPLSLISKQSENE